MLRRLVRDMGVRASLLAIAWCACCRSENAAVVSKRGRHVPPDATARLRPQEVRLERSAMGTTVQIVAYTTATHSKERVEDALGAAFREIDRVEHLLSSWTQSSDVARLNRAQGATVRVSPETRRVLERAVWASRISDGVFDVTYHVLGDLWRFGDAAEARPRVPPRKEIARRLHLIDYRQIDLEPSTNAVRIPAGMRLSLGGIAKGYIVDRAAQVLNARGLESFLVQAGGDLLGVGRKPSGEAWRSGVQDPRGPRGAYFAMLEFSDHAFSTAGDYARAYFVDGQRYHHIIDPRTGYPATACRSVTIWADDATTADALDDAVFILGVEKGLALVERTPGVGAVIVDAQNRVVVSRRLTGRLTILRQPTDGP